MPTTQGGGPGPEEDRPLVVAPAARPTGAERWGRLLFAADRWGQCLAPGPTGRTAFRESLTVFAVALLLAFFRLGSTSLRGVVWSEDGAIFLQGAHEAGLADALLDPYRGYAHVLPRLVAEPVSHLPLTWQGLALCLSAAVVQALVAVLAYHVVRAHLPGRLAAVTAALAVAAVPLGWEVVDNVANSQWFLLVGAVLAPLWSPTRWPGRVGSAVAVVTAALSSPFAGVAVAASCLVLLCQRSRPAAVLAGAGLAALSVQAMVVSLAPQRPALTTEQDASPLVAGFLRRVVGDGVLGLARHDAPGAPSVLAGLLVAGALIIGVILLARAGLSVAMVMPALLLSLAFVLFAVPVYLTSTDTLIATPIGRYYVAPAILLLIALGCLTELAYTRAVRNRLLTRAVFGGLVVAATLGLGSSWQVDGSFVRHADPGWSDSVGEARQACAADPAAAARIWQSPSHWYVTLPCAAFVGPEHRVHAPRAGLR